MIQMKECIGYIKRFMLLFSLIFTMNACVTEDVIIEAEDTSDVEMVAENRVICTDGFAGVFPCLNYDLLAHLDLETLSATSANDSWGWTDATTNKE